MENLEGSRSRATALPKAVEMGFASRFAPAGGTGIANPGEVELAGGRGVGDVRFVPSAVHVSCALADFVPGLLQHVLPVVVVVGAVSGG